MDEEVGGLTDVDWPMLGECRCEVMKALNEPR